MAQVLVGLKTECHVCHWYCAGSNRCDVGHVHQDMIQAASHTDVHAGSARVHAWAGDMVVQLTTHEH